MSYDRAGIHGIFTNAIVTGGNFTQHVFRNERNSRSPYEILVDMVAPNALHDSGAIYDPPKCHPNTRVAVLDKMMNWVQRKDSETKDHFAMWLNGSAGAGKTAIARSFIKSCLRDNLIIASFFFERYDSSRNHAEPLIATLVYQIYQSLPEVQNEIRSIIGADPLLFKRSLELQFTELIINPLCRLRSSATSRLSQGPLVIVIDGLNECISREAQQLVLRMISSHSEDKEFGLTILLLITSRPEREIRTVFDSQQMENAATQLYLDDTFKPDEDIRIFLKDSFDEIKTRHIFRSSIPDSWPTPAAIEYLVEKASGQFIHPETVLQYVKSPRHRPQQRLDAVMNLRPPFKDHPFGQLDALYTAVLSVTMDTERILYALSIYSLNVINQNSNIRFDISEFMSLDEVETSDLLPELGTVVQLERIPNRPDTLKKVPGSLQDFLLDPARSRNFFIDADTYYKKHVASILGYLTPPMDYRLIGDQYLKIIAFSYTNLQLWQSGTDLVEQAPPFPLLTILKSLVNEHSYSTMAHFIFFTWLPFLRRMACLDERWVPIEQQQHDTLDDAFIYLVSAYYDRAQLTALLCLVCYLGKEEHVPGCIIARDFSRITNLLGPSFRHYEMDDTLLLGMLNANQISTDEDQYRQCVTRFLQDPSRSGTYSIGADAYAEATLFFIQRLDQLQHLSPAKFSFDEHYLSGRLSHQEVWSFSLLISGHQEEEFHASVDAFLFLGYISFFLALSGRSELLIQLCREPTFLSGHLETRFPQRTALVRHAMSKYLRQFDCIPSGGRFRTSSLALTVYVDTKTAIAITIVVAIVAIVVSVACTHLSG